MAERCPLALLLAKRACATLLPYQGLEIRISDSGARSDIPRFLHNNGYVTDILVDDNAQLIIMVEKG
ncbi:MULTISPECIES: sulfurtransferase TusA family protein [unclassified Photobacterium]|nr:MULTISPECIES: sulfurtransferase TusA family protein [unclassified Photobacterium]